HVGELLEHVARPFMSLVSAATLLTPLALVFSKTAEPGARMRAARRSECVRAWPPAGERRGTAWGETPHVRVKLVRKDPPLRSPTARQISATEWSVCRSSAAARSSRRVSRYR